MAATDVKEESRSVWRGVFTGMFITYLAKVFFSYDNLYAQVWSTSLPCVYFIALVPLC